MVGSSSQQKESPERVAVINCEGKLEDSMVVGDGDSRIPDGPGKSMQWGTDYLISLNVVEGSVIG